MRIKFSGVAAGLLLSSIYVGAAEMPTKPQQAKPGECYARVMIPAKYESVKEKVLVKEASVKITVTPAKYETTTEEVEIIPASTRITPVPAVYKDVTEKLEVKPEARIWRTGLKDDDAPISPEILAAAKQNGIDVDAAIPGSCFKEYVVPRKFRTTIVDIVVQEEHNETRVIPATFEDVEKTIVLAPASKKIIEVPAEYETIEEKVLVEPEKTVWKKGENPAQSVIGATGEIMCLVTIPAKYKTIEKRIIKTPPTTKLVDVPELTETIIAKKLVEDSKTEYVTIPAVHQSIEKAELESEAKFVWHPAKDKMKPKWQYTGHTICLVEEPAVIKDITKKVLDVPAGLTKEINKPTYKIVEIKKLVSEAKEIKTPIPAEYKIVESRKKISDAHMSWKRILCQTNLNKDIIARIQEALNAKSYDAGLSDGLIGQKTKDALKRFQQDNSLATGGITYETLEALNIKL